MSNLASHPVPTADTQDEEPEEISHEEHRDNICQIKVIQRPGFTCSIDAKATLPLSAKILWEQALCHPENAAIFRHMDRCILRKLISASPDGSLREFLVEHEASWRFLFFSGKFTTKLRVEEDHKNYIMRFELLPSRSILKRFNGTWRVEQNPLDPKNSSFSHIQQDIAIGVFMPPPFDFIFKRISCRQVRNIFEDLMHEAIRISSGAGPTLRPYAEVENLEIGVDGEDDDEDTGNAVEGNVIIGS